MSEISPEMMDKLRRVGFCFPKLEGDGWLPTLEDLLYWLRIKTAYDLELRYSAEADYYQGIARRGDLVFTGGGPDLTVCVYKLVYKICRDDPAAAESAKHSIDGLIWPILPDHE